jgi:predicted metal-binding membrane protein
MSAGLSVALKRDRLLTILALLAVIGLAWAYMLAGAGMSMHEMDGMLMPMRTQPVTAGYAVLVFAMWVAMMAAMMLPSAAPMILIYETISRRRSERGEGVANPGAFTAGYLLVWIGFSLVAAAVQIALEMSSLLDSMMQTTSSRLAGGLLIAAGLYQWTPLKRACLRSCQSPLDFILSNWREGPGGAFAMGLRHGAICVGCCWALMLLLLVGGVMSLLLIAGIAAFVLVEKLLPSGVLFSRVAGAILVIWGLGVVIVDLGATVGMAD